MICCLHVVRGCIATQSDFNSCYRYISLFVAKLLLQWNAVLLRDFIIMMGDSQESTIWDIQDFSKCEVIFAEARSWLVKDSSVGRVSLLGFSPVHVTRWPDTLDLDQATDAASGMWTLSLALYCLSFSEMDRSETILSCSWCKWMCSVRKMLVTETQL